ncbi:hypothetical protein B6J05_07765 [Klebsiella quasipneumoniae]|nr:hypothetical protein B6J05_07765 [Klebsiella quasipneumoniae]ROC59273.1 hypothetical protein C4Z29_020430 [Klebsiella quasipneumoniae subsp. quasipneumoniae]PLJ42300.1 hypothetical protein B6J67_09810 [Klebsiella quasipneumoniae]PLJ60145.1 hypothetical protein B6J68_17940 [Klebsiella quasipneumoniae]PLM31878.1 hypothetical protein CWN41_08005 [Klebsiella quasipneumoniae]
MLSFAAANVGFVTLKLPARGAGAFVCSCQVICQVCQTDVKNASAEAWSTCADFIAGWRLRLTRPTCPGLTASRSAQAQRRRARTAGTEPVLCRVAAAPYPAYLSGSDCQ